MNVEQLKLLAIFMLLETSTVSATVGGSPKIATLTSDSGLQFLNEKEIKDLIAENQSRFAKYNKILLEHLRS